MAERRDLSVLRRLVPFVRQHTGLVAASTVLLPVLIGVHLLQPYLIRVAIDGYLTPALQGSPGALSGFSRLIGMFIALLVAELAVRAANGHR